MLGKKVGIDLGTTTTRIIVKGEGMIATEPTAVAIRDGGVQSAAFGEAAFETAAGDAERRRLRSSDRILISQYPVEPSLR